MITVLELSQKTGIPFSGDGSFLVGGFGALEEAAEHDLVYIENEKYFERAARSAAQAALICDTIKRTDRFAVYLTAVHPKTAFVKCLNILYADEHLPVGIASSASVASDCQIGKNVSIGERVIIKNHVTLGDQVIIHDGAFIGPHCVIGNGVILHPGVVLRMNVTIGEKTIIHSNSVIGDDGFGYYFSEGIHHKVLQVGKVAIGDNVEIGCCVAIDRGALGTTRIGNGTKIDNLVQIAHNVEIGNNTLITGQVGISGSAMIGHNCVLAGQVGVADHAVIEDGAIIAAQSGITSKGVKKGEIVFGSPARPIQEEKRIWAAQSKLPDLLKQIRLIKEKIGLD